jgi:hypothetical protein
MSLPFLSDQRVPAEITDTLRRSAERFLKFPQGGKFDIPIWHFKPNRT